MRAISVHCTPPQQCRCRTGTGITHHLQAQLTGSQISSGNINADTHTVIVTGTFSKAAFGDAIIARIIGGTGRAHIHRPAFHNDNFAPFLPDHRQARHHDVTSANRDVASGRRLTSSDRHRPPRHTAGSTMSFSDGCWRSAVEPPLTSTPPDTGVPAAAPPPHSAPAFGSPGPPRRQGHLTARALSLLSGRQPVTKKAENAQMLRDCNVISPDGCNRNASTAM